MGVTLTDKCQSPVRESSDKTLSTPEDHEMCRIESADFHTDAGGKSYLSLPTLDLKGHLSKWIDGNNAGFPSRRFYVRSSLPSASGVHLFGVLESSKG